MNIDDFIISSKILLEKGQFESALCLICCAIDACANSKYRNIKGNRNRICNFSNEYMSIITQFGGDIFEDEFHLFGDLHGKKILEIGCGRGHSLKYLGDLGASVLWGMDISSEQLKMAEQFLTENGFSPTLICSPMEEECGVPTNYFDYVYSVYGIGWTTNLEQTFSHIASYLKKDGVFIFSWSHPIHKCVTVEDDTLVFRKCYFDESWYSVPMDGGVFSLSDRKMSTYINALAKAGFMIEEMLEDPYRGGLPPKNENSEKTEKWQMVPSVFVIKARKL